MRTQGSLRVVLNTKVFAGMTIDRASPKSVRLTALDEDGLVKIFLIVVGRLCDRRADKKYWHVKATWSVCGFLLQNHVNQYKL